MIEREVRIVLCHPATQLPRGMRKGADILGGTLQQFAVVEDLGRPEGHAAKSGRWHKQQHSELQLYDCPRTATRRQADPAK